MLTFSPEPLVDISDIKDHLSIAPSDSSQDGKLMGFAEAASVFVQNITGPIIPITITESHNGGGPTICLNNPPILSIASVTEYVGLVGYPLTQTDLSTDGGAYAYSLDSPGSGVLRRRYGNLAGPFMGGSDNIVVTYTAGLANVPADIRMAVLQDIAGMFQPSQLGPQSQMFMGGEPEADVPNPIGLFPRVAAVLAAATMRAPSIG